METILFIVLAASFLLAIMAGVCWYRLEKRKGQGYHLITPLMGATLHLFIAVFLLYLPIQYHNCQGHLRFLLFALYDALRAFILESDLDAVQQSLVGLTEVFPRWIQIFYRGYGYLLLVAAPFATFTTLLELAKDFCAHIFFGCKKGKKRYIFSALNPKSLALATSIRKQDKKAVLVFTGVSAGEDRNPAEALDAICLSREVTQLDLCGKGDVEVFLLGQEEGENVSQAVQIAQELERCGKKENVKLFAFSAQEGAGYILDSLRCDKLRAGAARKDYGDGTFKIRRVDEPRLLVWNTLPGMNLFETGRRNGGEISVLIAGLGKYGMEYFKNILWFCQFEGFRLKLTVVDKRADLEAYVDHHCPDVMKNNCSQVDGDAWYNIRLIPNVDLENVGLESLALHSKDEVLRQRLKEVSTVVVALGDDDRNVETAVNIRRIYDRLHKFNAGKDTPIEDEPVQIYAIVHNGDKTGELRDHKAAPYHIRFVGQTEEMYAYDRVYDRVLEERAYAHHVSWVELDAENRQSILANEKAKYEQYEYYRLSSMATELRQQEVAADAELVKLTACGEGKKCRCEKCIYRKRSEHMRWVAYTRSIGYAREGNIRADRAKLHNKLCGWDELTPEDIDKD